MADFSDDEWFTNIPKKKAPTVAGTTFPSRNPRSGVGLDNFARDDQFSQMNEDSFKGVVAALSKSDSDKVLLKVMRTADGALSDEGVQLLENLRKFQQQLQCCGHVLANLHGAESPDGAGKLADLQHAVKDCRTSLMQRLYKVGLKELMRAEFVDEIGFLFRPQCTEEQLQALRAAFQGCDFVTLADFDGDVKKPLIDEAVFVVATFCGFNFQEVF